MYQNIWNLEAEFGLHDPYQRNDLVYLMQILDQRNNRFSPTVGL